MEQSKSSAYHCETCGGDIPSPSSAIVRVTGWGRGTSTGVKELVQTSAPFGYLCEDCWFTLKTKKQLNKNDSLF